MALSAGTFIGPYEVVAEIGAGGMGVVYRARDRRLNRDVALKVLPEAVANDPERLARFRREAQVLASLNHPHIAAIYGFEEATLGAGRPPAYALALELVEGPTLAERIAQGAIPVDEALPIATQIAEALEAAHERGVVHRDLKPANIKVRADGTVKVLDFGLAKAMDPVGTAAPANLSQLPTITTPAMTQHGVILGTAAYMSPEQARGKSLDKRTDIWAFGCVLYEMLAGRRAFEGDDVSDTLANVLKMEPPLDLALSTAPARIRHVVRVCLQKDARQRAADIHDVRLALDGAFEFDGQFPSVPAVSMRPRPLYWVSGGIVLGMVLAGTAAWLAMRAVSTSPRLARLSVVLPSTRALIPQGFFRNLDVSPDGSFIVYVAGSDDNAQLMLRRLDQLEAVPVRGGEGAAFPFLSPDGRWIGFFASDGTLDGGELRKVSIAGGQPITLCRYEGPARGATWLADDTIVFANRDTRTSRSATGLLRVPADGGAPAALTTPDVARREDHLLPSALPGGRGVLFTTMSNYDVSTSEIGLLDLVSGRWKTLIRGASDAQYVEGDYITYVSAGVWYGVRFDPSRQETVGDPVPLPEQVATLTSGAALVRAAGGTLAYVSGEYSTDQRSLVWVNRDGREEPVGAPAGEYTNVRSAPDNMRLAVLVGNGPTSDMWLWDGTRQALTRLTTGAGPLGIGLWRPDASQYLFLSRNVIRTMSVDTGRVEDVGSGLATLNWLAPDASRGLGSVAGQQTGSDIAWLHFGGSTARLEPLLNGPFNEEGPEVSPDGQWLAYQSNESGRNEVYVRPFPRIDSGRWQVSTEGGSRPAWSPDGRELFFLGSDNAMMRAALRPAVALAVGRPSRLFSASSYYLAFAVRQYDVSRDGQRFLMIKNAAGSGQAVALPTISVVLHWTQELQRLVSAR